MFGSLFIVYCTLKIIIAAEACFTVNYQQWFEAPIGGWSICVNLA